MEQASLQIPCLPSLYWNVTREQRNTFSPHLLGIFAWALLIGVLEPPYCQPLTTKAVPSKQWWCCFILREEFSNPPNPHLLPSLGPGAKNQSQSRHIVENELCTHLGFSQSLGRGWQERQIFGGLSLGPRVS